MKCHSSSFCFVLMLLAVSISFVCSSKVMDEEVSEERLLVDMEVEPQVECTVFLIASTSIRGLLEGSNSSSVEDEHEDDDEYECMSTHPVYATYTIYGDIESFVGPSFRSSETTLTFPASMIGDDKVMDLNNDILKASILVSLPNQMQDLAQTYTKAPYLEGTYKSLIIRVLDNTGDEPAETADDLYGVFFDDSINYNSVSVNSVFSGCSNGKFGIIPATGNDVTNGVVEITLEYAIADLHHKLIRDEVLNLLPSGIDDYTFRIMVYPKSVTFCSDGPSTCSTVGLGSKPGTNSWYRSGAVSKVVVGVHEIGHNLSLGHSGFDVKEYGDKSCTMGGESGGVSDGQKCFNAAKTYHLGWFAEYNADVAPTRNSFGGVLVGINDAVNNEISSDQYVTVRISDSDATALYLMYNRVEGVNKFLKNDLYRDKVVVVEQNRSGAQSWVKATLGQDEMYTQINWAGTGNALNIKVCSMVDGTPDTASVDIWLDGVSESTNCSGTSSPTASPAPTTEYKEVQFVGNTCTLAFPLTRKCEECTGDCDSDDECEDGLVCFNRSTGHGDVPGCIWDSSLTDTSHDFCVKPNTEEGVISWVRQCTESNPCGRCQGDCNSNRDCEGDLKCLQRDGYEEVPGCIGAGGIHDASGKDICYSIPTPAPTASTPAPTASPTVSSAPTTEYKEVQFVGNPCTKAFPLTGKCKECTGDCDSDDECEDGLVCFTRNNGYGDVPGCIWDSSLTDTSHDFCVKPNTEEGVISWVRKCTESNPCGRCQGDCNYNRDCEGDLKCSQRDGYEEVPGCIGAGGIHDASGKDICYSTSTPAPIISTPAPTKSTPAPTASTPAPTNSTPAPTASTPAPTASPTVSSVPTTQYKEVKFVENPCTSAFPLTGKCEECTGDCDNDSDCEDGLICFNRSSGGEDVPGCMWGADRDSLISTSHDFCIKPNVEEGIISYVRECNSSSPCNQCQGDCDGSSGCEGDLKCFQRDGYEEVPGCTGAGGIYDVGGKDICYAASTPAPTASTPAPVATPTPCADRVDSWIIDGTLKNWCYWAKKKLTASRCKNRDLYGDCPVACDRSCHPDTPAPVASTPAPVASTPAPIDSTPAPVINPTSGPACCDDMRSKVENIEVGMNNMKTQMENLSNDVEEIKNILQMFTPAPVHSTSAPVGPTPAPTICADRRVAWEINGREKNWCGWARKGVEAAAITLRCNEKSLQSDCPVTCGVCTP